MSTEEPIWPGDSKQRELKARIRRLETEKEALSNGEILLADALSRAQTKSEKIEILSEKMRSEAAGAMARYSAALMELDRIETEGNE